MNYPGLRETGTSHSLLFLLLWVGAGLAFHRWLGVIDLLLLGGPILVVPLGRRVHAWGDRWQLLILTGSACASAAVVWRSTSDDPKTVAVLLASVWIVVAGLLATREAIRWVALASWRFRIDALLQAAAPLFLTVGAWWLMESCRRIEFMGFSPTIVLLTAVHFHMAGFGACTVALARIREANRPLPLSSLDRDPPKYSSARIASVAGWLILLATPITAAGHLFWGGFEALGSIVMTLGLWTLAIVSWRLSQQCTGKRRWLLRTGAIAPFGSMVLALHYGLGRLFPITQIPYNTIAFVHGSLNLLGFLSANLLATGIDTADPKAVARAEAMAE
jgi:YndJ-like protein